MADAAQQAPLPEPGLSGHTVRGVADNIPAAEIPVDDFPAHGIEGTVRDAVDFIRSGLDLTSHAVAQGVETASDKIFSEAANVGSNIATQAPAAAQNTFSWMGYFQAIGILFLLLAALWFAVWCIRRYGKFNFLPRPGSLPKDSLIMEAQMPLGPKKGLMVVRFLNKRLLLGVTEHQISLITEEKAENEGRARSFQGVMDEIGNAGANSGGQQHPSA